jgi:iron complex transport system substrate-binding protein
MSQPAPTPADAFPCRIVCLTEETTETLYLLGEQHRIVGISGYTVRPPEARRDKPKVSAFLDAKIDKILALEPDLVLGFSDLQAEIANQLVRAGLQVHVFNQRTVAGILQMMRMLGAMVGAPLKAEALVQRLQRGLDDIAAQARALPRRPRVLFEEWHDPLISGIGWVSELLALAGGDDIFPELACKSHGKDRIIADPLEPVRRAPDIVIGSWCGRKFRPEIVRARPGWAEVPAVRDGELHEVKSSEILQPGPAALTDGVQRLAQIVQAWAARHG